MKYIKMNDSFCLKLNCSKFQKGIINFYKYSPGSVETVEKLTAQSEKLDTDKIVVPNALVFNKKNRCIGVRSSWCYGYKTLAKILKSDKKIDKLKLLKELKDCLEQMEEVGVIYNDIHYENILLKNDQMKLVDVDEALPKYTNSDKMLQIRRYIELVLDLYIFDSKNNLGNNISSFLNIPDLENFFTDDLLEYLEYVDSSCSDEIYEFPDGFLEEFQDEEKIKKIKEIIKK